jgi:hypothetical protein
MLMASAKTAQKLSAFLVPAKQGGLYVNEYCYYFTVWVIGGMDIFKSEITKPVRNDYCGNCIKSTLSEFSR